MILKNRKSCRRLQLFIVKCQQVRLGLLDLVEHVFSKLLSGLNLFALFLIDIIDAVLLLGLKISLVSFKLCPKGQLNSSEVLNLFIPHIEILVLLFKILNLGLECSLNLGDLDLV